LKDNKRNVEQEKFEEDDRVIANMNLDGMPMNTKPRFGSLRNRTNDSMYRQNNESLPELSKKELRQISRSATLAGLLVGIVFILVFFIFIMFCIYIWL